MTQSVPKAILYYSPMSIWAACGTCSSAPFTHSLSCSFGSSWADRTWHSSSCIVSLLRHDAPVSTNNRIRDEKGYGEDEVDLKEVDISA